MRQAEKLPTKARWSPPVKGWARERENKRINLDCPVAAVKWVLHKQTHRKDNRLEIRFKRSLEPVNFLSFSFFEKAHLGENKRKAPSWKRNRSDERKERRSLMLIFKSLAAKQKRNHLNSCFPSSSPGHNFPLLRFLVKTQSKKKTTERLNRSKSFFLALLSTRARGKLRARRHIINKELGAPRMKNKFPGQTLKSLR